MSNEFTSVSLKKSTVNSLKRAAKLINEKREEKNFKGKQTVSGLINQLAESYEKQMNNMTLSSNLDKWVNDGVPVILDSDASKHFAELKDYCPLECVLMVSNFIRTEAMTYRFKRAKEER